jgi:hypothetical protein
MPVSSGSNRFVTLHWEQNETLTTVELRMITLRLEVLNQVISKLK